MSVSKYAGGKTGDLFAAAARNNLDTKPLAERLRPRTLDEIVGQEKLLRKGSTLRRLIEGGQLPSMILWGPPGSGKTTLARVLANHVKAAFETISAVMAAHESQWGALKRVVRMRRYSGQLYQIRGRVGRGHLTVEGVMYINIWRG